MMFQPRSMGYGGQGGKGVNIRPVGYPGAAQDPRSQGGKGQALEPKKTDGPLFTPKAFPWNSGAKTGNQEEKKKEEKKDPNEPTKRVYEALDKITVRAEPFVTAKMKTKKSKGARVFSAEVTLNWWLKLDGEPGYMPLHMRGIDGLGEVARCIDDSVGIVAVENYHPQGICCLEVVFKAGAPIWEEPNRSSKAVATRRVGEYVFASAQNWDGWLKLASGEGWMQLVCPKAGELLKLRKTRDMDVWALNDVWNSARKTRKTSFGSKEVQALKDLERRIMMTMSSHLTEVQETGSVEGLLAQGLLKAEDLDDAACRVRAKLFANILVSMVREEALFRELAPNFALSAHIPPLPATEDEEEDLEEDGGGGMGDDMDPYSWYEQGGGMQQPGGFNNRPPEPQGGGLTQDELADTQPFAYEGKVYRMTPSGVLFDPPNDVPVGLWNAKTQLIEPAAGTMPGCPYTMLSYFGKSYVVMPDNAVIDPSTEEVVGILNQETNQIDAIDPVAVSDLADKAGGKGASMGGKGARNEPEKPVLAGMAEQNMKDAIERGDKLSDLGSFEEAAVAFTEALAVCRRSRSIDMEEEVSIIRKRASCWAKTGRCKELLEDAEYMLNYNDEDTEADEWKRMATLELIRKKAAMNEPKAAPPKTSSNGSGYDAPWKPPAATGGSSASARSAFEPPRVPPRVVEEDKACAYCGIEVEKPSACSKCRTTYYCGRNCQRNHWKTHKHECGKTAPIPTPKPAAAAVVEEDGAGMEELD